MGLFVVRHRHPPRRCPAEDPAAASELLHHLSRANAARAGVHIEGEAVVSGDHTLVLIVEAAGEAAVRAFMAPFERAGSVEILAASSCARVVANGGCTAPAPAVDSLVPLLAPDEACQDAVEAGLVVHRAHPLNCETSLPDLVGGVVMPTARFYVRNHFHIPTLDAATWRLDVGGLVDRPLRLTLDDLRAMPARSAVVTLECAGNGRSLLEPRVDGEQWGLGAVSTAEWTGVPLVEVLERAGPRSEAREVVFRGADRGTVDESATTVDFERGLSLEEALESEALLAYAMNGEPLPIQHGYPLRLVVPGWYAVASVKWLTNIDIAPDPFLGFFQVDRYFFEWQSGGRTEREPARLQRVRALVVSPQPGQTVEQQLVVRGVAWSGAGGIQRVDVSVGEGEWHIAQLVGRRERGSWQWWEAMVSVDRPGPTTIRARATDLAGRVQPERPDWNRLGYGSNPIQQVPVVVTAGSHLGPAPIGEQAGT